MKYKKTLYKLYLLSLVITTLICFILVDSRLVVSFPKVSNVFLYLNLILFSTIVLLKTYFDYRSLKNIPLIAR